MTTTQFIEAVTVVNENIHSTTLAPVAAAGGGAAAFTDLTDAMTADLPSTNEPLMQALAGKAEAPYAIGAVHLDTATSSLFSESLACTDSRYVAFSFWYTFSGEHPPIFTVDPDGDYATYASGGNSASIDVGFGSEAGAQNFIGYSEGFINTGGWFHCLIAVDTQQPAGQKILARYLNDVRTDITTQDLDSAFIAAIDGKPVYFGGRPGGGFAADYADFWFATGQNLLVDGEIPEATRRKFIDANGFPVDLGADGSVPTGTAPDVFFHAAPGDEVATFQINRGTGGAFSLVSTLSASGNSPSDPTGFANPMLGAGDMIGGGAGGIAQRLANPGAGTYALQSINGALTWTAVV